MFCILDIEFVLIEIYVSMIFYFELVKLFLKKCVSNVYFFK